MKSFGLWVFTQIFNYHYTVFDEISFSPDAAQSRFSVKSRKTNRNAANTRAAIRFVREFFIVNLFFLQILYPFLVSIALQRPLLLMLALVLGGWGNFPLALLRSLAAALWLRLLSAKKERDGKARTEQQECD